MTRFLASILLLLALSVPAVAQPGPGARAPFIPPKDANYDLFRGLLHFHGVKPVTADELRGFAAKDYRDLIVVVLGCTARGESDWAGGPVELALKNGGAVVIASDRKSDLSWFFPAPVNASIDGGVVQPPDGEKCYGNRIDFPVLRVSPDVGRIADPALDLFAPRPGKPEPSLQIVANRPSGLNIARRPAALPRDLAFTFQRRQRPLKDELVVVAAGGAGTARNPYRCLVLADQDILSNRMLYASGQPDQTGFEPGNWTFANRLASDFLRAPHARTKCLFVESGEVRTDFDKVELKSIQQMPTIPPIPLPDPLDRRVQAKLAEVIDGGLAKMEDSTVADNLLAGPPNDPSPRRYQTTMTVLAAAAGVVLVVLMARRLLSARHRKKFVPAPSDPLFLGDDTALGSFGQRRAERLRGTDFRAAVAHGVRALFAAQGLPAGYGRRRLPPLQYCGRSDRERLGGDIRDLWDAAARDEAVSLSYAEWKDLEPVLAEVHAAAAADRWRFAPTSPQGSA